MLIVLYLIADNGQPALASRDTDQRPSAIPPVGEAFPLEIVPSTPHSGLPST